MLGLWIMTISERISTKGLAVLTQYQYVTDRQTDGQTQLL